MASFCSISSPESFLCGRTLGRRGDFTIPKGSIEITSPPFLVVAVFSIRRLPSRKLSLLFCRAPGNSFMRMRGRLMFFLPRPPAYSHPWHFSLHLLFFLKVLCIFAENKTFRCCQGVPLISLEILPPFFTFRPFSAAFRPSFFSPSA